jgi:ribonuclease HI
VRDIETIVAMNPLRGVGEGAYGGKTVIPKQLRVLPSITHMDYIMFRVIPKVERHPDTLGPVIVALSKRRARTILVKVDAHKGHQGNERADRLAETGRRKGKIAPPSTERSLRIGVRRGEEAERHRLGAIKKVVRQGEEEASLARVKAKHAKKPTKMTNFLLMQNVGIPRIGKAMNAAPLTVASFQIKSIGGLVPRMRRLAICGMAKSDRCPLRVCGGDEVETIEHMQSRCEALKNARMSAHNAIAETTTSAVIDALLCSNPGWKRIHEKTASSVWDAITTSPLSAETRSMKPDAVVIDGKLRRAHILEFNRPWDKDLTTLQDRARQKRERYGPLMDELKTKLPRAWIVILHPMIIGVRGLTDEVQMTASLKLMRMDEEQSDHVQDDMTREALAQGLVMWKARNARLKGTAEQDKDARTSNKEAAGGGGQRSGPALCS